MAASHLILCRPFSSCPQSLPASGSIPMSQLFTRGGQSTGVSALAVVPGLISCPQSLPESGSIPMSQLFARDGQSTGVSPLTVVPGLISFRMDWLNLFAFQGILKSLLQHHSSKVSIHRHSAFFTVQHSHPYMTTGKTIALTRWTFVGKVMPLLFNMLFRLVITFLPRSKRLLISWLQSPSVVILEPPQK